MNAGRFNETTNADSRRPWVVRSDLSLEPPAHDETFKENHFSVPRSARRITRLSSAPNRRGTSRGGLAGVSRSAKRLAWDCPDANQAPALDPAPPPPPPPPSATSFDRVKIAPPMAKKSRGKNRSAPGPKRTRASEYRAEPGEKSSLADHSGNLITRRAKAVALDEPRLKPSTPRSRPVRKAGGCHCSRSHTAFAVIEERRSTTSSIDSTRMNPSRLLWAAGAKAHIEDRGTAIFPFPFAPPYPAPVDGPSSVDVERGASMLGFAFTIRNMVRPVRALEKAERPVTTQRVLPERPTLIREASRQNFRCRHRALRFSGPNRRPCRCKPSPSSFHAPVER